MRPTTSNEIRQAFLDYFNSKGHEVVASSPLPNYDNPTLLFTNAGMNQFTELFLGKEKRSYTRAATSQKVMRVQGKHVVVVRSDTSRELVFELFGVTATLPKLFFGLGVYCCCVGLVNFSK